MKNVIKLVLLVVLMVLSMTSLAWQLRDLWQSRDQQGTFLLQSGQSKRAAQVFKDINWQAVALYRAGDYAKAFELFDQQNTSDGKYNAGNALAQLGRYEDAILSYDRALALNSNNKDAKINREIIKKILDKKKQAEKRSCINPKDNKENKENDKARKDNEDNTNASQKKDSDAQLKTDQKNYQKENDKHPQQKENDQLTTQQAPRQGPKSLASKGDEKNLPLEQTQANLSKPLQSKEEGKNQLLRRLADDPGGLLRQKFRRDYLRRHEVGDY